MSGNSAQPTYAPWQFNEYVIAFEGNSVACIFSGIYFVIAARNLYLLQKKRYRVLWLYSAVQLIVTIIYVAISLYAAPAQSLGIFNITAAGPDATSPWPAVVVNIVFILNTWISDAFLLYRCYVVCMGNKYAVAFPALLYLVTLGSSLAWLVVSTVPGAVYSNYASQAIAISYWSCSVAMNVCASCLISARLWMYRRAISAAVGAQQGAFYLGYMAMTLESASLYTIFAIIALVVFTLNNPLANVFIPLLGVVQVIAPSFIVYRIVRGISIDTDACATLTTNAGIEFTSPRSQSTRQVSHDRSDGSDTVQGNTTKGDQLNSDSSIHEIKHVSESWKE